jgi:hypothetical protein
VRRRDPGVMRIVLFTPGLEGPLSEGENNSEMIQGTFRTFEPAFSTIWPIAVTTAKK